MKNLIIAIAIFYFILSPASGQIKNDPFDIQSEEKLVEKTIHNCIGWAKNKYIKILYSLNQNDKILNEINPDNSLLKGLDELMKD